MQALSLLSAEKELCDQRSQTWLKEPPCEGMLKVALLVFAILEVNIEI
jgi:hypothetical protein